MKLIVTEHSFCCEGEVLKQFSSGGEGWFCYLLNGLEIFAFNTDEYFLLSVISNKLLFLFQSKNIRMVFVLFFISCCLLRKHQTMPT